MQKYSINFETTTMEKVEITLSLSPKVLKAIAAGEIVPVELNDEPEEDGGWVMFYEGVEVDALTEWDDEGEYVNYVHDKDVLNEAAKDVAECKAKRYGAELIDYNIF